MPEPVSPHTPRHRIVHVAQDFESAATWDRRQHRDLSPLERLRAARVLKDRVFPLDAPDVRACHTSP